MTHVEDYSGDAPHPFPRTATAQLREKYVNEPFTYSPADQEAMDRRDAERNAALQAALSIESAIRPLAPSPRHPLLAEREHTHGDFAATAMIAQRFKDISKSTPNWSGNLTDIQREALEGIFTKIARILSGDPNHPDHWRDIAGGAHLVEEQLP